MAAIVTYVHTPSRTRPKSQNQIYIEASRRVQHALLTKPLWQLSHDLENDEIGRRFAAIGVWPSKEISNEEHLIRDQMIEIVKERRWEERVLQGKIQSPAKGKERKSTSWCRNLFCGKKKETEMDPGLKAAERVACARVYQALVVEKRDSEVFEMGLCEERRRLWGRGVRSGVKHVIIAFMLDIIAGRRKMGVMEDVNSIHSQAAFRLGKALARVVGDEGKLEKVFGFEMQRLKAEGLEDGEEFETLRIMLKMIYEGREKAKWGHYGAGF